jgi:glyoxalase family protein
VTIQGLHHITLVSGDAQRTTDFYTGVLGLRLIKQTVNFDAPDTYHLYFGDATGSPGSAVTFFEWPDTPQGRPGVGGTHHLALAVADRNGLLRWKRRLTDMGIRVNGPLDRHYFTSIYFRDPDGVILEIATLGPGMTIDEAAGKVGTEFREPPAEMIIRNRDAIAIEAETWPEPVPVITADMALMHGMHHISAIGRDIQQTDAFYQGLLGMQRVKMTSNFDDPNSAHWYWGVDDGRPGTLITYFERPNDAPVQMGRGQTHHFAFAVADEDTQLVWREKLIKAGLQVTPVQDRVYFKSIYLRDPDGHIVEIATAGPGFLHDEDVDNLGTALKLPPWLEAHRASIENGLTPLTVPTWQPAPAAAALEAQS